MAVCAALPLDVALRDTFHTVAYQVLAQATELSRFYHFQYISNVVFGDMLWYSAIAVILRYGHDNRRIM